MTVHGLARGAATAAAMFVLLGTVAALWNNPFFTRMTPAGAFIGFLGIACPVCNKLLVLLIGSALLLEYFEPVRLYVALGGAALLALAVWLKLARPECLKAEAQAGSTPA